MKNARIKKGLNQSDLARILGVHPETIRGIERGRRTPSLKLALKLSKILNISIEKLLEKDDEE